MKKGRYVSSIKEKILLLEEEDFLRLKEGRVYNYTSISGIGNNITENFLSYLIRNDDGYEYFNRIIDSGNPTLKFAYLVFDRFGETVSIDVSVAIKLLEKREMNTIERARLRELKRKCSPVVFLDKIREESYTTLVGEKEETVSVQEMIKVFTLDENAFKKTFAQLKIQGLESDKFAYMLTKYLKEKTILQRYRFNEDFVQRYRDLLAQKYVDFQRFEFFEGDYEFRYNVKLNSKLKGLIYKNMDPSYSDLEKSIYVYIRLCKLFSYDPSIYASGQRGENMEYHRNLQRIEKIENGNEDIVCYEFNVIYGKFLDDLNIRYRINAKKVENAYGKGHANLTYNSDKYLIFADSVTSIINGDLVNAKLNLPLEGLKCENLSIQTQESFKEIMNRVYADVVNQEKADKEDLPIINYLDVYRKMVEYPVELSIDKKMQLLIDLTNSCNLKLVDTIGYMNKLKRILFTKQELEEEVNISVIRTNIKQKKKLGLIITKINPVTKKCKYWYYAPQKGVMSINGVALKHLIKKGIIEAIEGTKRVIPGIGELTRR